jgi:hypothetical protein
MMRAVAKDLELELTFSQPIEVLDDACAEIVSEITKRLSP